MLKVKGDTKKKQKIHNSIDREGLGIGFMDFLDNIQSVVRNNKGAKEYKKTDYDFNDDAKEVLLEESDLVPLMQDQKPVKKLKAPPAVIRKTTNEDSGSD